MTKEVLAFTGKNTVSGQLFGVFIILGGTPSTVNVYTNAVLDSLEHRALQVTGDTAIKMLLYSPKRLCMYLGVFDLTANAFILFQQLPKLQSGVFVAEGVFSRDYLKYYVVSYAQEYKTNIIANPNIIIHTMWQGIIFSSDI